jgi:chemotaxis protein histidine kinase CheA
LAKNTDHLAGGLDTDNTGGVLSGLLAEEDDLDRRALWRIGSWGVGAVAAVILAVMANQTSLGWKRDQVAAADLSRQAQQIQQVAKETHSEARRLASAIDTLNSDRDRLYTRVTTLEQGLDSMTGAIARQNSAAPPSPSAEPQAAQNPAPAVAPVASQAATSTPEKPANTAATEPSPAMVSSVAKDPPKDVAKSDIPKIEGKKSSEAAKSEAAKSEAAKPEAAKAEAVKAEAAKADAAKAEAVKAEAAKAEAAKAEAAKADAAKAVAAKSDAAKSETAKSDAARIDIAKVDVAKNPDATPATPLVAAKSFMAAPDPSAAKLIEPTKPISPVTAAPIPEVVASAPASDAEADEETAPKVAVQRTQFGVDLGTANSVPGLRALWRGLLKSRSNAPLTALRPIIVIKEGSNGLGMQLRLVAGPLNDAGAAAKICAVLTENDRKCETAIFDGQRLSVTGEDPAPAPAASKPSSRRRGATKRAAAMVVDEPPKRPEISTTAAISSWFGKRGQ